MVSISLDYPSGEEGGYYSFKLFLPACATLRGGGGGGAALCANISYFGPFNFYYRYSSVRGKVFKMRSVACVLLLMMYTSCAAGVTVYEYFTGDGITQVVFNFHYKKY